MLSGIYADTRASILFLSRLPMSYSAQSTQPDFRQSSASFALAGLVIATPSALVALAGAYLELPSIVTVILAVGLLIIVTGALHEDGLADTADGFWGGYEPSRRLEIMRDSHIGTYGVIALILSLGLRMALLHHLLETTGSLAFCAIVLATAGLSRGFMLYPWTTLPSARAAHQSTSSDNGKDAQGLSHRFGTPDQSTLQRGALAALPACLLLVWSAGVAGLIIALLVAACVVWGLAKLSLNKVGGHTGDTLGATQQVSELGLLFGLVCTM